MKKYLLTLGATALTVTGFAQGTFSGKNTSGGFILAENGVSLLSKTVGKVELLDGNTVLASGNIILDGKFALGVVTDPASTGTVSITVRAWDSSLGSTFAAAQATGHGYGSAVVSVALATGTTPPSDLTASGFTGFSLTKAAVTNIPEPTTVALAALGLGGLMFISRRK